MYCCVSVLQAGWNLNPCKSCGSNVLTDTNPSDGLGLSADQCYIPPGWGASFNDATKQLVAYKCNNGGSYKSVCCHMRYTQACLDNLEAWALQHAVEVYGLKTVLQCTVYMQHFMAVIN